MIEITDAEALFKLTPTERDILRHLAGGRTMKEIAALRGRSPKTVDVQRRNIYHKTNSRCIADITRFAIRVGLVAA